MGNLSFKRHKVPDDGGADDAGDPLNGKKVIEVESREVDRKHLPGEVANPGEVAPDDPELDEFPGFTPLELPERQAAALRDIVHGYSVVLLNGKRAFRKGWREDPIRSGLEYLDSGHRGNHGVAPRDSDRVLVVDVDVKGDVSGTDAFRRWVGEAGLDLRPFPHQRTPSTGHHFVGKIPEDYPADALPNGTAVAGVDVLRDGRQFARAPGVTDSGEYTETNPLPPLAFLPEWSAEFLDTIREDAGSGASGSPPPQKRLRAPTVQDVAVAVSHLPNRFPDRDRYIQVGAAIKAAVGPENEERGLHLYQSWAARWKGGENDPATVRKDWDGLHAPFSVGWSKLQDLAREHGDYDPAQETFEADREPPKEADSSSASEPAYTVLSGVQSERVSWLWPGRVPLGKITTWDGDPGLGKSGMLLDLAARVTTGRDLPDGSRGLDGPGGVVLVSAEDGVADTIVPRLEVAGADLSRIAHLYRVGDRFIRVQDAGEIAKAVRAVGARLVVVDPVMAFLGTKDEADSYRDQDVRSALLPITDVADKTGAAVILVRHLPKSRSAKAIYAGGGSMGIVGAARSGFLIAEHPRISGQRVMASVKNNLAPAPPSLAFNLESAEHPEAGDTLRINWRGRCNISADDLLREEDKRPTPARDEAQQFLQDLLSDEAVPVKKIKTVTREAGLSFRTVRAAKDRMNVQAKRVGGVGDEGHWVWVAENSEFSADTDADELDNLAGEDDDAEAS